MIALVEKINVGLRLVATLSVVSLLAVVGHASVTASSVTVSNTATATHVDNPYDFSATFSTSSGTLTGCEKTTNGSSWSAGSLVGGVCSSTGTSCTNGAVLTINMRATNSLSEVGASTAATRTCDSAAPTTTNNAPAAWQGSDVTVTLSPTDSGSGVASTRYCTDTANTCVPGSVGTSTTVACGAGNSCQTYVRYYSQDNVGNVEATSSTLVRIDKLAPTTTSDAPGTWQANNVTVTLMPMDFASGVASTHYCTDTANTCVPGSVGTSTTVACGAGNVCQTYLRYYSQDNAGNVETTTSTLVLIDKQAPTGGSITYPPGGVHRGTPINISFTNGTDGSGSGLGTRIIQSSTATLNVGVCGTFGSWGDDFTNPASSPVSESFADKKCVKYQFKVWDSVSNLSIYTSANIVKVQ